MEVKDKITDVDIEQGAFRVIKKSMLELMELNDDKKYLNQVLGISDDWIVDFKEAHHKEIAHDISLSERVSDDFKVALKYSSNMPEFVYLLRLVSMIREDITRKLELQTSLKLIREMFG